MPFCLKPVPTRKTATDGLGLKDLEAKVSRESEQFGLPPLVPVVTPHVLHGIEINPFAAELARVTIWIGQIQWNLSQGLSYSERPILAPLNQIDCRDALLNPDGTEADWPAAECIVGNPPFLGDKKMIAELGESKVGRLRSLFAGRVPGGADLVTYWFEKARADIESGKAQRAGLVATNSIRGGRNRKVLDRIALAPGIFDAWADLPWVLDGAAVRVSLISFGRRNGSNVSLLDGQPVAKIHADLTGRTRAGGNDLTQAQKLIENADCAFIGMQKNGPFDVAGSMACLSAPVQTPLRSLLNLSVVADIVRLD